MKQLTKCPGPSMHLWVVWELKTNPWRATGLFTERDHAEEHAKPGDKVIRYKMTEVYRARAPHTLLELEDE